MADNAARQPSGLLPAYLMVGADELKKKAALARLERRLEASGDPVFNQEMFEGGSSLEAALVRSSLDTLPFGADFRLVMIREVDHAPKDVTEMLVSYLKNPCATTLLAMTATKLAKSTRLYKAVAALGEKAVIDCAPKKRWELPEQVAKMAAGMGKTMDSRACELLVQLVGESTTMLDAEVRKLASAVGAAPRITAADVQRMVARVAEVKPWDFLDAVSRRDPHEAMKLYRLMGQSSPVGLFVMTVSRIRQLITAKALVQRGQAGALASELGLQQWQVKNFPAWARNYSMDELVDALRSAPECERSLKSSPDKDAAFQGWVLSFCRR